MHTATLLSKSVIPLLVFWVLTESLVCSSNLCRSVTIVLCSSDVFIDFSFQTPEERILNHV